MKIKSKMLSCGCSIKKEKKELKMSGKLAGKINSKEIVTKLIFIVIGNLLCSIAFNVFFIPNKLLSSGVGRIRWLYK